MDSTRPTHREVVEATAATEASMRAQRVPVNVYETPGALVIVVMLIGALILTWRWLSSWASGRRSLK